MRRMLTIAALGCLILTATARAQVPAHPRLIADGSEMQELWTLAHPTGVPSTWTQREKVCHLAYRSIVTCAENLVAQPYGAAIWTSQQGAAFNSMMKLAMAHRLRTGEPGYDGAYASYAIALLTYLRSNGYPMWATNADPDMTDMNTGELLGGWAFMYDWLYPEIVAAGQQANVVADLLYLLRNQDVRWTASGNNDSNHVAVCWGGRGLAALALAGDLTLPADEDYRNDVATRAASRIIDYFDGAYPGDGAGYEGVFYAMYGLNVSLPYALAADRFDDLPASQQVHVADLRSVQQAANWCTYEQLPFYRYGGSYLNDTAVPPDDLNHPTWRSWPWLMAFWNPARPSLAKELFRLSHSPAEWDAALAYPFNPDSPPVDLSGVPFSRVPGYQNGTFRFFERKGANYGNAVAILVSYPPDDAPPAAFQATTDVPASRAFTGRGEVILRTQLPQIDGGGSFASDPDAPQIVFECRARANWNTSGHHAGHYQHDMNHFVMSAYGVPLFYDCGYEGGGPWQPHHTHNHNLHELSDGAQWTGFPDVTSDFGALGTVILGTGFAPSAVTGDNTVAWTSALVDRAQRTLISLPRPDGQMYAVMYDDFDFNAQTSRKARWFWHSANTATDPGFEIAPVQQKATIRLGSGAATTRILTPALGPGAMTQQLFDPDPGFHAHYRLQVETPNSPTTNLIALIETHPSSGAASLLTQALGAPRGTYAYRVRDGQRMDIVGVRPASATGDWSFAVDGRMLTTDAQIVVLRFSDQYAVWPMIESGLMVRGTHVFFDDQFVMGVKANGARLSLAFSEEEVAVHSPLGSPFLEYFVGPVIPEHARIDGQIRPVTMMNVPHPLTCLRPLRVGRSPANDDVFDGYRYDADVTLRNWAGAPVVGWPVASAALNIVHCVQPSSGNLPDGPSDAGGHLVWHAGLTSGGSCEVAGGRAVEIKVNFDGSGLRTLTYYDAVSSPDEDGDGIIDSEDFTVWQAAMLAQGPLYQGDLNLDGEIDGVDHAWFVHHRDHQGNKALASDPEDTPRTEPWMSLAQERRGILLGPTLPNPSRDGLHIPFAIPRPGRASLTIFDLRGRLVQTVVEREFPLGVHWVHWDGRAADGAPAQSGVYLYQLQVGDETLRGRAMLVR